jgi:ElaB/YqjD/DUF883 family membrane-anchored ribosome-binding protein
VTNDTSDPTTITRELAETRARLDARLEELETRLSPGQLVDSALDYLRQGEGAAFVRNLGADLRDNPLPVAVTGIGLAWLMSASALSNMDASHTAGRNGMTADQLYDEIGARAQRAGESLNRLAGESEEAFQTRVAEARAQSLGIQRDIAETADAFVDRVQQALDTVQQNARDRLEQMRQMARQGREMASRAGGVIADTVNENPLVLGALGLAAGVLFAALLPATEQEEAVAAPVGGAIRRAADEAIDRGKRAAEAAAEAAYHEVAEPG